MSAKKLKLLQNLSLFEPSPPEARSEQIETCGSSSPPVKSDSTACPRCGSRSLKTVRPFEHDNHSHYCAGGCLSEDRMDAFYFTPQTEAFDQQAAREEAKRIMVNETQVREILDKVEADSAPMKFIDGQQQPLIETGERWQEHWKSMPEFVQEDLAPWKSIYVHFETREDMERFAKLVKQKIGLNTRSVWYPEAQIGRLATKRYVEKGATVDARTKNDHRRTGS